MSVDETPASPPPPEPPTPRPNYAGLRTAAITLLVLWSLGGGALMAHGVIGEDALFIGAALFAIAAGACSLLGRQGWGKATGIAGAAIAFLFWTYLGLCIDGEFGPLMTKIGDYKEMHAVGGPRLNAGATASAEQLPGVAIALESGNLRAQRGALHAAGKLGPAAVSLVPQLVFVLESASDAQVLAMTLQLLADIGPSAKPALAAARTHADSSDSWTRNAARRLVEKLDAAD
jgi:hypothetical protein